MINIKGINRAELLAALYNGTKEPPNNPQPDHLMTTAEARDYLNSNGGRMPPPNEASIVRLDYVYGRPIKVDLVGDELEFEDLYDRDAPGGAGSCQRIIEGLRVKAAEVAAAWGELLRDRPAALMTMTVSNDGEEGDR